MQLRNEIASLQDENESYRSQRRHTHEQKDSNDLRGFRLQAIREELIKMTAPFPGGQVMKLMKSQRLSQPKNSNQLESVAVTVICGRNIDIFSRPLQERT
jgi:hypothetical protein